MAEFADVSSLERIGAYPDIRRCFRFWRGTDLLDCAFRCPLMRRMKQTRDANPRLPRFDAQRTFGAHPLKSRSGP